MSAHSCDSKLIANHKLFWIHQFYMGEGKNNIIWWVYAPHPEILFLSWNSYQHTPPGNDSRRVNSICVVRNNSRIKWQNLTKASQKNDEMPQGGWWGSGSRNEEGKNWSCPKLRPCKPSQCNLNDKIQPGNLSAKISFRTVSQVSWIGIWGGSTKNGFLRSG